MPDHFKDHSNSLTAPANCAQTVTPNDASDLTDFSRAIYIGGAGSLSVELAGNPGQVVTLSNAQAGMMYPLRVKKVLATGTTATGILSLW